MNLSIPLGIYATNVPTSGTSKPDVSDMLEVWAHKDTPFLNRISWGADTSVANVITWLTEHLGWRYVETSAAIGTATVSMLVASGVGGLSRAEQMKQFRPGTLCYAQGADGSESGDNTWFYITTVSTTTLELTFLACCTASIAASAKVYIVGSFANEGSVPDRDTSRKRSLLSNNLTILRYDIQMTGSQAKTDMYAVPDELQHQTKMRLLEMQLDRERAVLLSRGLARSATIPGFMDGVLNLFVGPGSLNTSWAAGVAGGWIDDTTTALGETAFNNMVATCFENGGRPNCVVGGVSQIRKFTSWATDRIRSTPDTRVGGQYITQYMSDVGITLDLVPMMKWPTDLLFILDDTKMTLRAKTGRKLIIEKLGKVGDYDMWQLISEFSLEHHGFAWGQHGMFSALA